MNSIATQMIEIYVFVDDFMERNQSLATWRDSNNNQPELTICLAQNYFGLDTLPSMLICTGFATDDAFARH